MTPASAREIAALGHRVLIERNAARAIDDADYETAGAEIAESAAEILDRAEPVVKVKEPQPDEISLLRENRILFTCLHLAPDPERTQGLLDSGCSAYGTATDSRGRLPLLAPMSGVTGRMAVHAGATCLEIAHGGRGVPTGGVPGVAPEKMVGGGLVGGNALFVASGMGGGVTVTDRDLYRPAELDARQEPDHDAPLQPNEEGVLGAALVIAAALAPGDRAPKLVASDMVREMKRGAVIVDVATGSLLREEPVARRADVRRGRSRALWRYEHAGSDVTDLRSGPRQRRAALRGQARRPRPRERARGGPPWRD